MRRNYNRTYISRERLFNAINNGHSESTVEALLHDILDIDATDSEGLTPLLLAAKIGRRNIFELLIRYGANVDIYDHNMWTALHHVSYQGRTDMAQFLAKRLTHLNARDMEDCATALHFAARRGHPQVVRCLVELGADVDAKTFLGATPLMWAAIARKRDVVDLLLCTWADINICDDFGDTVLHYVSRNGWLEVVQSLVKRLLDFDAKDLHGCTALLVACKYKHSDIARYLFQEGASCEGVDSDNHSPLHYLIKMEEPPVELIKLFMENVADLRPVDYDAILNTSVLKVDILQDAKFCCQVIVSKFNKCDLPELYKSPVATSLPHMEGMKIVNSSQVFRAIEGTVQSEIKKKGYCNPFKLCPNVLKVLCIKSVLGYLAKKK